MTTDEKTVDGAAPVPAFQGVAGPDRLHWPQELLWRVWRGGSRARRECGAASKSAAGHGATPHPGEASRLVESFGNEIDAAADSLADSIADAFCRPAAKGQRSGAKR